jgi:hypothetical protein
MKMSVNADFISNCQPYVGKEKTYFKAKFSTVDGGELEVETSSALNIPRFANCGLVVDVIQGKYPRYVLTSYDVKK